MTDTTKAREICEKWVALIGLGFHPDTRGADYVFDNSDVPFLSKTDAAAYDADMDTLFSLDVDPYEYGLAAMKKYGLT